MKNWKNVLALLWLFTSLMAQAGEKAGNGGFGVLCRHKKTAEVLVLDLVEAFGYGLPSGNPEGYRLQFKPDTRLDEVIDRMLLKLGPYPKLSAQLQLTIGDIVVHRNYEATPLPRTNDYGKIHLGELPKGCEFTQIARFTDEQLYIEAGYIRLMDVIRTGPVHPTRLHPNDPGRSDITRQVNFWALLTHEGVYKLMRRYLKAYDSEATRKIVGNLFASDDLLPDVALSLQNIEDRIGEPAPDSDALLYQLLTQVGKCGLYAKEWRDATADFSSVLHIHALDDEIWIVDSLLGQDRIREVSLSNRKGDEVIEEKLDKGLAEMNQVLSERRPLAISYTVNGLFAAPGRDAFHASVVVGRKWGEVSTDKSGPSSRECLYLVKNSYGSDWRPTSGTAWPSEERPGFFWVSEKAIRSHLFAITYLKP